MSSADREPMSWADFARQVIEQAVRQGDSGGARPPSVSAAPFGGAFVTLHKGARLRGCMGTLDPDQPLSQAVRQAAVSAALHDPRFPPLSPGELAEVAIEVSILSPMWPMHGLDELTLGTHGILVQRGGNRGLFLPSVAVDHHLDKQTFLSRCCSEKAELPPDAWRDPQTKVLLFTAEVHREPGGFSDPSRDRQGAG